MLEKNKIDRINELARKDKQEGLSKEEKEERELLRKEYLANFRSHFKSRLENIKYVEDLTEEELAEYQNNKK